MMAGGNDSSLPKNSQKKRERERKRERCWKKDTHAKVWGRKSGKRGGEIPDGKKKIDWGKFQ